MYTTYTVPKCMKIFSIHVHTCWFPQIVVSFLWGSSWQWTPQLPGTTHTHVVAATVTIYGPNMFSQMTYMCICSLLSMCICVLIAYTMMNSTWNTRKFLALMRMPRDSRWAWYCAWVTTWRERGRGGEREELPSDKLCPSKRWGLERGYQTLLSQSPV